MEGHDCVVSYIILADGPSQSNSFRPNDDETQWWARRDALVRITNQACYIDAGVAHPATNELFVVFNEVNKMNSEKPSSSQRHHQQQKTPTQAFVEPGDVSVLAMFPTELAEFIPIPTEQQLVSAWRKGFMRNEASRVSFLRQARENGIQCANRLDLESRLIGNRSVHADSSSLAATSMPDTGPLSKREVLALLQGTCSMEFLRSHALNASEAIVLKKNNKDKLVEILRLWCTQSGGNSVSASDINSRQVENDSPKCIEYRKLFDAFVVILKRCLQSNHSSTAQIARHKRKHQELSENNVDDCQPCKTTLLMLHEDYPHELPVFGAHASTSSSSSSSSGARCHVICALGGVRDASDLETCALIAAAHALDIDCKGVNLGRTAEFTSKIVGAMGMHALAGPLGMALNSLPALPRIAMEDLLAFAVGNHGEGQNGVVSSIPQKLLSVRKGHVTWDGHSSKSLTNSIPGPAYHSDTIDADTTSHAQLKPFTSSSSTSSTTTLCFVIHARMSSTALTVDIAHRTGMHRLIQSTVNALWKSRMASEEANEDDTVAVICALHVLFDDQVCLSLDRKRVAQIVAAMHMAAPSESQILRLLVDSMNTNSTALKTIDPLYWLPCVLSAVDTSASSRKGFVRDSFSLLNVSTAFATGSLDTLSSLAYAQPCDCTPMAEKAQSTKSQTQSSFILILLDDFSHLTSDCLADSLYQWCKADSIHRSKRDEDKEAHKKRRMKLSKKIHCIPFLDSREQSLSTTAIITALQHFAYHHRLVCPPSPN